MHTGKWSTVSMSYWVQFTTGYNHWPTEIYHQWLQSPTTKLFFGEHQTPPNYFFTTWHLNTWDVWQFWQISHRLAAVNDDSVDALILWSASEAMLNSFWLVCRQGRRKQDGNKEIGVEKEVEAADCLRTFDSENIPCDVYRLIRQSAKCILSATTKWSMS